MDCGSPGVCSSRESEDILDLCMGAPGSVMQEPCSDMLLRGTVHALEGSEDSQEILKYGEVGGSSRFRHELAKFLADKYGSPVSSENLYLTCGSTHGLHLVVTKLLRSDAVIFLEDATYFYALEAFRQNTLMTVKSVPLTENGINTEEFERIVKETQHLLSSDQEFSFSSQPFWAMLYTIPHFHNPTTISTSEENCRKIVEIACKYNILIFSEDVYNLLYFGHKCPRRLFEYDLSSPSSIDGHVISSGSFSKIVAPSLRLGWLELPPKLRNIVNEWGLMKSGGAVNHYMSTILAATLQLGLCESYVCTWKTELHAQMEALCSILEVHLPEGCTFVKPSGGYFMWIKLPSDIKSKSLADWLIRKQKIKVLDGESCTASEYSTIYANYIRLSFAYNNKETLIMAGKKLCMALQQYIGEKKCRMNNFHNGKSM